MNRRPWPYWLATGSGTFSMQAVVLRRRDIREYDQIITLYTRERGRIEALARGVKKITSKNSPLLEPPALVEVEIVKGKEIDHLTTAHPIQSFPGLRSNLEKLEMNTKCIHLVVLLIRPEQPDEHIFDLLTSLFIFLNSVPQFHPAAVQASFLLKLAHLLGYAPALENCTLCGQKIGEAEAHLSARDGGLIHATCAAGSVGYYGVGAEGGASKLQSLLRDPWEEVARANVSAQLLRGLLEFVEYHAHVPLQPVRQT